MGVGDSDDVQKPLKGSMEKLFEWHLLGYRVILVTSRPMSMKDITIKQLAEAGAVYNDLIMDVGVGHRVLINDMHNGLETAHAINIQRNEGIKGLDLQVDHSKKDE